MLNVNRLRILREVAARGTLASAAEALFMTPSAVSQQMAVLEREAGTPLTERDGRRVRLTDAGLRLVAHAEDILAAIERAEADMADASQGLLGHVRLSAFPTGARALLVPSLVRLKAAHPNLRLSMFDLEPEESIPALKAGHLDLVVTYEWDALPSVQDPGIERELLLVEPVYVALPRGHRLAGEATVPLGELRDEEWIVGRDSTSMLDLVVAVAAGVGFSPRTNLHSMDFEVILAAVEAGLGAALVPPLALIGSGRDVSIQRLENIDTHRTVYASIRRGSGGHPGIAVAIAELRAAADAIAPVLPGTRDP